MRELITLWQRVLGDPPDEKQFAIWLELHTADTVRRAILKTAIKNQQLTGNMSDDHKFRFASRVMISVTTQSEYVEEQRALRQNGANNAA
jgi:hypothetical protein